MHIYHIFFIHFSVDGQLGCFHVLATVNSADMNIGMHISFGIIVFSEYMPRSGIVESFGKSIFSFKLPFKKIFFFFFRATPAAYGVSQARGQIGAVAADLHHSHNNVGAEACVQPTP